MSFLDMILVALVVVLAVVARPINDMERPFDRETTATLRGIAMLGIILHHIHNRLGMASPILLPVGYLATGLFFFISGYGNAISIERKSDIIKLEWFSQIAITSWTPRGKNLGHGWSRRIYP